MQKEAAASFFYRDYFFGMPEGHTKTMTLSEQKKSFRAQMRLVAKTADAVQRKNSAGNASAFLREQSYYADATVVFSYMALSEEADTLLINERVLKDGKTLALPRIIGPGLMDFFSVDGTTPIEAQLTINAFGIAEPGEQAVLFAVDQYFAGENILVIVPGLAFTKDGKRLGRGKGYYDRYLSRLKTACARTGCKVTLAGYCLDFQLVDDIPCDEFDLKVDFVFY
jgi:5-formyltetrahydrofolate cyclo-ligase